MKAAEKDLRDALSLKTPGKGLKNYSIKAGAGAGKTTLLSRRICSQIADGTPIDGFVIITYTNAAANELRDKISDGLREIAADTPISDERNKNAKEALNNIELIQISTIHAFLLKVLREYAFETGVVLDVKMLEDDEDNSRKEKFFNKWYHKHFDEIVKYSPDWIHKTQDNREYDVTKKVFWNLFRDIANVREEIICDTTDHTIDFEKAASEYVKEWLPQLSLYKNTLLSNVPKKKDGSPISLIKAPEAIIEKVTTVESAATVGCKEACLLSEALAYIWKSEETGSPIFGKKYPVAALLSVTPTFPEWTLEWDFKTLYEQYMVPSQRASKVAEYVCKIQKDYQKEIDAGTLALSNDDILYRAERLLIEHPKVLDKLRNTYSKIYVDEFQDTTGLQARLVKMLSEKAGTALAANDLQEDKLIVVGDPKQSIYRFTGAEKPVYDEMDRMMAALPSTNAESVALESNYRSNKTIVDWVNTCFAKTMPSGYTPMETDWEISEHNALHGVFRYEPDFGVEEKDKPIQYNKDSDVNAVVDLVNKLVDVPNCFIEIPDRRDDESFGDPVLRRIKYSDIMIICKNTTKIKNYVKTLSECGIPVSVQGKFKVSDDEILRNFALLIEYVAGFKNKKKRYEAAQILGGFDSSMVDNDEIKKVEGRLNDLRSYFRDQSMDTAAIVRYILTQEELFLPKGKEQRQERVREYRIRLNQMIEKCLSKNDGDLSRVSILMNEYIESEIKRENPLESNENSVRLMNVHQAKGLTGNIVIIADRSNKEGCNYGGFKSSGRYFPAASYKLFEDQSPVIVPSFGWDLETLKQAYMEETEEAIRLQYVAATRAAHALIIMPVVSGRGTPNAWFSAPGYGYMSLPDIRAWISERTGDTKSYTLEDDKSESRRVSVNLSDLETNKAKVDLDKLSDSQLVSITPSGLEPRGSTGFDPSDSGYDKEDRPGGNVFGVVMHRAYELLIIRYERIKKISGKDQERAIERIINQAILESSDAMHADDKPEEFFKFLKIKMMDYFDKVITPIMTDAAEIYPEYIFSFYVDNKERADFLDIFDSFFTTAEKRIEIKDEPIWVNGQADLVVKQKDGGLKVYDYKSDARNGKPVADFEASLGKKYEGQLALYKYAIGKAFGASDVKTELIHLYK